MTQSHMKQVAIWALTENDLPHGTHNSTYVTPCNPLNPTILKSTCNGPTRTWTQILF